MRSILILLPTAISASGDLAPESILIKKGDLPEKCYQAYEDLWEHYQGILQPETDETRKEHMKTVFWWASDYAERAKHTWKNSPGKHDCIEYHCPIYLALVRSVLDEYNKGSTFVGLDKVEPHYTQTLAGDFCAPLGLIDECAKSYAHLWNEYQTIRQNKGDHKDMNNLFFYASQFANAAKGYATAACLGTKCKQYFEYVESLLKVYKPGQNIDEPVDWMRNELQRARSGQFCDMSS